MDDKWWELGLSLFKWEPTYINIGYNDLHRTGLELHLSLLTHIVLIHVDTSDYTWKYLVEYIFYYKNIFICAFIKKLNKIIFHGN